ncbi:MAG: efflux RND transporter permease subunit, partial [Candidatus Eisenbacteria bacterium]|nr:efflux RND transporter permease subunit [Candidatus Eisenbacteria bacterium]
IVIPTLLFSLVESKLILPNHLSHLKPSTSGSPRPGISGLWTRMRRRINHFQEILVERSYKPSLSFAVRWRYLTLAGFSCLLLITVGLIGSGRIAFTFFPKVESDTVVATLTLPLGTPVATTSGAVAKLEAAAEQLRTELGTEENGDSVVKHMLSSIGSQPFTQAQANDPTSTGFSAAHLAEVSLELAPSETRTMSSPEIASRWRELVGEIPGGELSFQASLFSAGSPIDVQLAGPDMVQLQGAADRLKEHLGTYQGVFDITDSYQAGKMELLLQIKPEAEALGLSLSDLAAQVRAGFYGEEAQRIQRGRDEVKVMVRYPKDRRHSLAGLENMRVRTQAGGEVPFSAVATAELGRGYATISRADRNRTISVLADVDEDTGNANEILASVQATFLPQLLSEFPGVTYSFEGEQQQQRETMGGLRRGFMFALIIIYTLMAIPFRSYTQPLVVMLAIPFGLVGAIWGHMLLGMNLTILSMFGIVALSGVVVNDSIVLVDQINVYRRSGMSLEESVLKAGPKRFRAILLTSLTTVAGLTPMLLEKSVQAQFLIPIAVSLAFGVLFATFIILLMVPASYLVLHDILNAVQRAFRFVFTSPQEEVTEP